MAFQFQWQVQANVFWDNHDLNQTAPINFGLRGLGYDTNNYIPRIVGADGTYVNIVGYNPNVIVSYPNGVAPPELTSGPLLRYTINGGNSGGSQTPAPAQSARAGVYATTVYVNGYQVAGYNLQLAGYPGVGGLTLSPYTTSWGAELGDGRVVVVSIWSQSIVGGVSDTTPNCVNAAMWLMNPNASGQSKAVLDLIPFLPYSPGALFDVHPCATGQHIFVITGTTVGGGPDRWHVLSIPKNGTNVTVVSSGTWPYGTYAPNSVVAWGAGSSNWLDNSPYTIGMLESDLQTVWLMMTWFAQNRFCCLSCVNGQNASTVGTGAVQYPGTENGPPPAAIYADAGAMLYVVGTYIGSWTRYVTSYGGGGVGGPLGPCSPSTTPYNFSIPIEIDVAKANIAGDSSVRTFFCGTDAPRFTDLGLASGLVDGSSHPVTGSSQVAGNAGPYPIFSRKLGVPNPSVQPTTVPVAAGPATVSQTTLETFDAPVNWNLVNEYGFQVSSFDLVHGHPGACLYIASISGRQPCVYKNFTADFTYPITFAVDMKAISAYNFFQAGNFIQVFGGMDSGGNGFAARVRIPGLPINTVYVEYFQVINHAVSGAAIAQHAISFSSLGESVWATVSDGGLFNPANWYKWNLVITPVVGGSNTPGTGGGTPTGFCNIALTITDYLTNVVVLTDSILGGVVPQAGSSFGMGNEAFPGASYPNWSGQYWDNVSITGQIATTQPQTLTPTAYLYTLVNDLGQESGPSLATTPVTRDIGQAVTVNLPGKLDQCADTSYFTVGPQVGATFIPSTQIAPNQSIPSPSMNLYRAVTGSSGTTYMLVAANIPFSGGSVTTYTDSIPDANLITPLQSLLWYPPPTNMFGILALPNGIYAGFAGNQLCLSVQGNSHAWPIAYRLTFDYNIIGVGNIDNTVVVCTPNYPYLCAGNTPDQYSQTKANYPYGCASKRSIQFLQNVGIVYATFEGLIAIAGPGQERLLTKSLFSKDEWLALNPASMVGVIYDNRYYCFYQDNQCAKGGFYLDMGDAGVGKVSLAFHANARYKDPLSDNLYLILDANSLDTAPLNALLSFDQNVSTQLPYVWKSRQFYVPWPTCYRFARITADDYTNLTLTLFADGTQFAQVAVTSQTEFALPQALCQRYFEFQLSGTSRVTRAQFVEDIAELQ